MATTEIEFVLDQSDYESARELVKKICEDYESKRNLHIRIMYRQPIQITSPDDLRKIVNEEIDRRTANFISGFEELNKEICRNFLSRYFPLNFKMPSTCNDDRINPDAWIASLRATHFQPFSNSKCRPDSSDEHQAADQSLPDNELSNIGRSL